MFERYDSIDWKKLEDEQEIPPLERSWFETLASPKSTPAKLRKALSAIETTVFDQACLVQTSHLAAGLLIEVLSVPKVKGVGSVLALLGEMVTGGTGGFLRQGLDVRTPAWKRRMDVDPLFRALVAEILQGWEEFRPFLNHRDADTRSHAAFLLAWNADHSEEICEDLRARLGKEKKEHVRASLFLSLAMHLHYGKPDGVLDAVLGAVDDDLPGRAAAIGVVFAHPDSVDDRILKTLAGAVADPASVLEPKKPGNPPPLMFAHGDLRKAALQALAVHARDDPAAMGALLVCLDDASVLGKGLARQTVGQTAAQELVKLLPSPVEVDRLYEGERAMLAVMAGRPAVWNKRLVARLKDVGLPGDKVMLGRVLGVVSPGVISRHLDPAGVGKTFSHLLVNRVRAVVELHVDDLLEACPKPFERVELARDLFLERFDDMAGWRAELTVPEDTPAEVRDMLREERFRRENRSAGIAYALLKSDPSMIQAIEDWFSTGGDQENEQFTAIAGLALAALKLAEGEGVPDSVVKGFWPMAHSRLLVPDARAVVETYDAEQRNEFLLWLDDNQGSAVPLLYLDQCPVEHLAENLDLLFTWDERAGDALQRLVDAGRGEEADSLIDERLRVQEASGKRPDESLVVRSFTRSDGETALLHLESDFWEKSLFKRAVLSQKAREWLAAQEQGK